MARHYSSLSPLVIVPPSQSFGVRLGDNTSIDHSFKCLAIATAWEANVQDVAAENMLHNGYAQLRWQVKKGPARHFKMTRCMFTRAISALLSNVGMQLYDTAWVERSEVKSYCWEAQEKDEFCEAALIGSERRTLMDVSLIHPRVTSLSRNCLSGISSALLVGCSSFPEHNNQCCRGFMNRGSDMLERTN